ASKPVGKANIFNDLQEEIIELDELKSRQLADAQSIADSMDLGPLNLADGPIVIITTAVYYFHPDHLGTSTLITDMFGDPYQFFLNLPFGESMAEQRRSGSFNNPYKFNGKELDEETGLYYYGARYYNPRTSVWLSVDPLAEQFPNWSPYTYALNNPIRFIDPDGRAAVDAMCDDCPGPGLYQASVNTRYIGFGLRHPIAASRIGFGVTPGATDISTNSTRFATRGEVLYGSKRTQEDRGSENGAFRHGLWQAAITSEFGSSIAAQAGNAHEVNAFADLSIRSFSNLDAADETVDLLNNVIGRRIGRENEGANMLELANLVLDEFHNNGLYTASKDKDGNWRVSKTKLSTDKYNQLKEIFSTLNQNGRTNAEQKAVDDRKKEFQDARTKTMQGLKW